MPVRLRLLALLALLSNVRSVDHAKFRTCQQTGFCRRHRGTEKPHAYVVAPGSLAVDSTSGEVTGTLHGGPFGVWLALRLIAYDCGAARLRITEANPLHGPRWEPTDILEADLKPTPLKLVAAADLSASHPLQADVAAGKALAYKFDAAPGAIVAISYHPFKAVLFVGDAPASTEGDALWDESFAVSYTHLTLPTILRV